MHVILFPRRQRATTASAWRQLGVPSCTSASGCPWYQGNTSPEKVIPSMCAKTRERRGKEQERRRGRASTERESERKRRARSVERRYTGRTKRGVGRGESERERSLLVLLVASWPRTANEGVARWRARGRGKGDGWWNQTGAAATRRVSRSLCRAWKKRGEGRGSSKAAGKAGSSTYGWRATSAV